MTVAVRQKNLGMIKVLFALLIVVLGVFAVSGTAAMAAEEDEEVFYRGIVTNTVNVRTGPGQEYDRVTEGEEQLQLSAQDEVVIIGEDVASTGITWYQIRFMHGGKEVEGYATSSYIAKTDEIITPSPTPEPTPTNTPVPTPTDIPAPTEPLLPADTGNTNSPGRDRQIMLIIIVVLALSLLLVILFIVFRLKKTAKKTQEANDSTRKVDNLKKLKLEEKLAKGGHRQVQIKAAHEEPRVPDADRVEAFAPDVTVDMRDFSDAFVGAAERTEELKENMSKDAGEKKALREAIENLKEHDVVIHKFFGEGEVYDNSDVKLLEVRFGNDVRFLNKDSLVSKKLLEVCDEEQMTVKHRSNARRPRRPRNTGDN